MLKEKISELEFKAAWFHHRWFENNRKSGKKHHPNYHISPFIVAPLLRADGRTYCDKCDLNMTLYDNLPETKKNEYRETVQDTLKCEIDWQIKQKE